MSTVAKHESIEDLYVRRRAARASRGKDTAAYSNFLIISF
jgi:hypothetical protein